MHGHLDAPAVLLSVVCSSLSSPCGHPCPSPQPASSRTHDDNLCLVHQAILSLLLVVAVFVVLLRECPESLSVHATHRLTLPTCLLLLLLLVPTVLGGWAGWARATRQDVGVARLTVSVQRVLAISLAMTKQTARPCCSTGNLTMFWLVCL